jgi:hypothetical protein
MSGFVVLPDGRAWVASNDGFDSLLTVIAAHIQAHTRDAALAEWLLSQRSLVLGPGMGALDIRELHPQYQHMVLAALETVSTAPVGAHDLAPWETHVTLLAAMLHSYRVGEPPAALNPMMKDVLPSTGQRSGPGW